MPKIYTKTGDKGTTSLLGGKKLDKDDIRIEAYGTIDELNSQLGCLVSHIDSNDIIKEVYDIQLYLFTIGSHLAKDPANNSFNLPDLDESKVSDLENRIDSMTKDIPPLRFFVLPGGSQTSSFCHVCRTVCRRAERRVVSLAKAEEVNTHIIIYLNRLSDYLFTLARYLNHLSGVEDIPWKS